jgi:hypothetical protein
MREYMISKSEAGLLGDLFAKKNLSLDEAIDKSLIRTRSCLAHVHQETPAKKPVSKIELHQIQAQIRLEIKDLFGPLKNENARPPTMEYSRLISWASDFFQGGVRWNPPRHLRHRGIDYGGRAPALCDHFAFLHAAFVAQQTGRPVFVTERLNTILQRNRGKKISRPHALNFVLEGQFFRFTDSSIYKSVKKRELEKLNPAEMEIRQFAAYSQQNCGGNWRRIIDEKGPREKNVLTHECRPDGRTIQIIPHPQDAPGQPRSSATRSPCDTPG